MYFLIPESGQDIEINLYGIDGGEHTSDFFAKHLCDGKNVYPLNDEERAKYSSFAEYAVSDEENAEHILSAAEDIQNAIDEYVLLKIYGYDINGLEKYVV